jgi:trypsin
LSGGTVRRGKSWVTHPDYDVYANVNDIAILKLSKPVPKDNDIEFAVLASAGSDPKSGSMATAAGW